VSGFHEPERRGRDRVATPSVLVVDDSAAMRRILARTLEAAGYRVTEAPNGQVALALCREQAPDLVLLDIDMPRLDGIETCRRLRADPGVAGATVVMLTAAADQERASEEAGADLFLTKPFSPLDLLRLVDGIGGN
jgi:CheY-like chemotaxis protein